MKIHTLHVFDPAMCCSTGVCGPDIDPRLVQFAADLEWLKSQGVIVRRDNLSQNPAAFVENPVVQAALGKHGAEALPLLLLDGQVTVVGRYPDHKQLAAMFKLDAVVTPAPSKSDCCCGDNC